LRGGIEPQITTDEHGWVDIHLPLGRGVFVFSAHRGKRVGDYCV
jgi:hypothetical protein